MIIKCASGLSPFGVLSRFFTVYLCVVVAACGGGDSPSSVNDNESESVGVVAHAGDDIVVNAGETVELEAGGSGDIVGRTWTRVSGPSVSLNVVDLYAGRFTFIAPGTGQEASLTMEYRLTVKGSDGSTDQDSLVITINRVNQPPEVGVLEAFTYGRGGTTQRIYGFYGDPDGEVVSVEWNQVSGPEVTLEVSDVADTMVSFEAPDTDAPIEYVFEYVVVDNDGAESAHTFDYIVYANHAPSPSVQFPPRRSAALSESISFVGQNSIYMDRPDLGSVSVTLGGKTYEGEVTSPNEWRIEDVSIVGEEDFIEVIEVMAEDAEGTLFPVRTQLHQNRTTHGDGPEWAETVGLVAIGSQGFVLTSGAAFSDVGIVEVSSSGGDRKESITDNGDETQGPVIAGPAKIIVHRKDSDSSDIFYVGSFTDAGASIISVDRDTGERSLVTGDARGDGPMFESVVGMEFGRDQNEILVSDTLNHAVYRVDVETGDREVVVDGSSPGVSVQWPLDIAYDRDSQLLYVIKNIQNNTPIVVYDLSQEEVSGELVSRNEGYSGPDLRAYSSSLELTGEGHLLLFNTGADNLVKIDVDTGYKELIASDVLGHPFSSYEASHSMLYDERYGSAWVLGGRSHERPGLYMVELESADKVLLSR